MKKALKQFRYGEKGFTLIELLVVVAVLGVLAAVAVPNVGKFLGEGTEEAANTEAHNVQTAVLAYMVDNSLATCDGSVGPAADIGVVPPDVSTVKDFITGDLQATYAITDGEIAGAIPEATGKWSGLEYTPGVGWGPAP